MRRSARPYEAAPPGLRAMGAILLAGVVAAGCFFSFEAPDVRIADVRVAGVGLTGATAEVTLWVVNPNRFELRGEQLRYHLAFEDPAAGPDAADDERWRTIAEGGLDDRIRVPARDSASLTVPVPFSYDDLGRAVRSLLQERSLDYRVTGDVLFDSPGRDVRVPFSDTGRLGL